MRTYANKQLAAIAVRGLFKGKYSEKEMGFLEDDDRQAELMSMRKPKRRGKKDKEQKADNSWRHTMNNAVNRAAGRLDIRVAYIWDILAAMAELESTKITMYTANDVKSVLARLLEIRDGVVSAYEVDRDLTIDAALHKVAKEILKTEEKEVNKSLSLYNNDGRMNMGRMGYNPHSHAAPEYGGYRSPTTPTTTYKPTTGKAKSGNSSPVPKVDKDATCYFYQKDKDQPLMARNQLVIIAAGERKYTSSIAYQIKSSDIPWDRQAFGPADLLDAYELGYREVPDRHNVSRLVSKKERASVRVTTPLMPTLVRK